MGSDSLQETSFSASVFIWLHCPPGPTSAPRQWAHVLLEKGKVNPEALLGICSWAAGGLACMFPVPGLSAGTCPSAPGSPLSLTPAYLLRKLRQCGPVQKELEARGHRFSSASPSGGGLGEVTRLLRWGSPYCGMGGAWEDWENPRPRAEMPTEPPRLSLQGAACWGPHVLPVLSSWRGGLR